MKRKRHGSQKALGQHFLYDPAIARRIIEGAMLAPGQTVVELGAGRGILTKQLAYMGVRLLAIELDENLYKELSAHFNSGLLDYGEESHPGDEAVELLNVDFTKVSLTGLLASRGVDRCILIGNIPYHLSRHVLFSFLVDEVEVIERAYLMLQREVGERIVSPPGNRTYGITSVILQSLYEIRITCKVAPGSFFPPPKVDSVVLEFRPLDNPLLSMGELRYFTGFVKNLFQQRRKTIHNTMKAFYSLPEASLKEVQAATEIDLRKRPEALSKEEFLRLSRTLTEVTKV